MTIHVTTCPKPVQGGGHIGRNVVTVAPEMYNARTLEPLHNSMSPSRSALKIDHPRGPQFQNHMEQATRRFHEWPVGW